MTGMLNTLHKPLDAIWLVQLYQAVTCSGCSQYCILASCSDLWNVECMECNLCRVSLTAWCGILSSRVPLFL